MAGLGAVIDALAGRYQLPLQGTSYVDGGPVSGMRVGQSSYIPARQTDQKAGTRA
jgi:hypothetical protein